MVMFFSWRALSKASNGIDEMSGDPTMRLGGKESGMRDVIGEWVGKSDVIGGRVDILSRHNWRE